MVSQAGLAPYSKAAGSPKFMKIGPSPAGSVLPGPVTEDQLLSQKTRARHPCSKAGAVARAPMAVGFGGPSGLFLALVGGTAHTTSLPV
jgi:hypothetical protein